MDHKTLIVAWNGKPVRIRVTKTLSGWRFQMPSDLTDLTSSIPQPLADKLINKYLYGTTKRNKM